MMFSATTNTQDKGQGIGVEVGEKGSNDGNNNNGSILNTLFGQAGFDFLDNICCMSSYQNDQVYGETSKINSVINRCGAGISSCDYDNSTKGEIGEEDDSIVWLSDNTMTMTMVEEGDNEYGDYDEDECSSDGGSWGSCGDQSSLSIQKRETTTHENPAKSMTRQASSRTQITSNRKHRRKCVNSSGGGSKNDDTCHYDEDDDNQTTITAASTGNFSGGSSSCSSVFSNCSSNIYEKRVPLPILDTPSVLKQRSQKQQQQNNDNQNKENCDNGAKTLLSSTSIQPRKMKEDIILLCRTGSTSTSSSSWRQPAVVEVVQKEQPSVIESSHPMEVTGKRVVCRLSVNTDR